MAEEKAAVYQRLLAVLRRSLVRDRLEKLLLRRVSCAPGALSSSVRTSELMMKHYELPYASFWRSFTLADPVYLVCKVSRVGVSVKTRSDSARCRTVAKRCDTAMEICQFSRQDKAAPRVSRVNEHISSIVVFI